MIYEFMYRGPVAAERREAAWHVILAEEVTSFGEQKLVTRGPLTPAQAAALGYTLDKVVGDIAATALLSADAAKALVSAKDAEIEAANSAKDAAEADFAEQVTAARKADEDKAAAQRVAADAIKAKQEVDADLTAAMARIDELTSEPEGPKNPALHFLTGGLLGG